MEHYRSIKATKKISIGLGLDDESYFRRLAIVMMEKIPISELEKVMKLSKKKLPKERMVLYEAYLITQD